MTGEIGASETWRRRRQRPPVSGPCEAARASFSVTKIHTQERLGTESERRVPSNSLRFPPLLINGGRA